MSDTTTKRSNHRPLIITIAVIAVIGISWRVWHKVIRHEIFPRNFGIVETGEIYRSGQLTDRALRKVIAEHDIKTIIDLSDTPTNEHAPREQATADELGVERFGFQMAGDGKGDPDDYAEVIRLMEDPENHPVLVHCAAGAQRTGVAVVLYRHLVQGQDIETIYPETFDYKHKPKEWIMLAFLLDNIDEIRTAYGMNDVAATMPDAPAGTTTTAAPTTP